MDWQTQLEDKARRLQRQNKQARWIYLTGLMLTLALAILMGRPFGFVAAGFMAVLLWFNERMIRKMRDAGFP